MKLKSFLILCVLGSSALFAENEIAHEEDNADKVLFEDTSDRDPDMDALRKWIREKRLITVKETGGDFSISGDLRTNFIDINEKNNGIRQRGHNAVTDLASRAYKVAFNLMLDYRTERTWAAAKLGFSNAIGVQTGKNNNIKLSKAFFGGRMIAGDSFSFDGEIGRRSLGNVYDSKLEFASLFDGALLRFSKAFESIGDYYTNLGVYLINTKRDYYGYVGEMGFLNIGNTGAFLKASYIDWKKYHCHTPDDYRFNYRVSQLLFGYLYTPKSWPKLIKFYGAALYNDAADTIRSIFTPTLPADPTQDQTNEFNDVNNRLDKVGSGRYNWAWYAGVSIGQARKAGDWAIDTNFQWVQAQAIPNFDVGGIGRGNAQGIGLYVESENQGIAQMTNLTNATGNCNYYGWLFQVLYAFTNNVTLMQEFEISNTLTKEIGPDIKYRQFKMEMIFTF